MRLQDVRSMFELSAVEVAQKAGIDATTYRRWESGATTPRDPHLIRKVAGLFDIAPWEIAEFRAVFPLPGHLPGDEQLEAAMPLPVVMQRARSLQVSDWRDWETILDEAGTPAIR